MAVSTVTQVNAYCFVVTRRSPTERVVSGRDSSAALPYQRPRWPPQVAAIVGAFVDRLRDELAEIEAADTYKRERVIMSPQGAEISVGSLDTIVYPSCFDANAGLFEVVISKDDATLTDELKHASIIDGIRLCKAERHRFKHMNTTDLEQKLKDTQHCRTRLIATDGVFTMDGDVAPLQEIVTPQSVASLAAPYVSRRVASSTMT
ncbi:hypothetical protein PF007_g27827 [Phytophthora fragariae]|uniref:Aminotransferase class I/classII large domain-containing protein n=1 Tax=Phytophthora fragariae TaxID=53985 RepID=A0A6A3Q3G9_9STRA|nr:hypothetical protein PF007_g27827 [Phytophthora fragariae]